MEQQHAGHRYCLATLRTTWRRLFRMAPRGTTTRGLLCPWGTLFIRPYWRKKSVQHESVSAHTWACVDRLKR